MESGTAYKILDNLKKLEEEEKTLHDKDREIVMDIVFGDVADLVIAGDSCIQEGYKGVIVKLPTDQSLHIQFNAGLSLRLIEGYSYDRTMSFLDYILFWRKRRTGYSVRTVFECYGFVLSNEQATDFKRLTDIIDKRRTIKNKRKSNSTESLKAISEKVKELH